MTPIAAVEVLGKPQVQPVNMPAIISMDQQVEVGGITTTLRKNFDSCFLLTEQEFDGAFQQKYYYVHLVDRKLRVSQGVYAQIEYEQKFKTRRSV